MELNELILEMFSMECKLFMKTDSYRLIEQKCDKKCFNREEQQLLDLEIHDTFRRFIKTIMEACPNLSKEDVIFCCLKKLGLENLIICHCMGKVSIQPENQRKYRIKKKMKEASCEILFDVIFSCQS